MWHASFLYFSQVSSSVMIPLWNVTGRAVTSTLRNVRLPSRGLHGTGVRSISTNRTLENVVTSPFSDVQQPLGNLVNTVFENVNRWGSRTALECPETGRNYTFNQLLDGMSKWAGFLNNLGVTKGDVIAIYMPNCPEYPIVLLGAISIGVIVTPINHHYTIEEVAQHLKNSDTQLLVGIPTLEAAIEGSLSLQRRHLPLVMNGPSSLPGALDLQEILRDPTVPYVDAVDLTGEELCVLPYSSGTTGLPKGVSISHRAISMNLRMATHPSVMANRSTTDVFQDCNMSLMPFYHMYGMVIMMLGLHSGAKLLTFPFLEPNLYINTLKKNQVETLHLVPTLVNFLINSPVATPEILSSLKTMMISASPFVPSAAEAFMDKFKRDIFMQEAYGMTEALLTCMVPLGEKRIGTTGKLLSNMHAKIVDTSTGEILGPNQKGEICFKTPSMMSGYFQNEVATSSTIDDEGWLHSGDVGFFDDDEFLKIVDRTKELIKVKGLQVSPSELENVIRQHPQVLDVGVVGVPHDQQGEVPKAFVVTKNRMAEEDIHRFIENRVAAYKKLVGGVTFVKELPRTPTGKLLRRKLKEEIVG